MQTLILSLRLALYSASFCGLCVWTRARLRLEGAFAPLVTACLEMAFMMLCGMAGILRLGGSLLFLAGFAALFWQVFARRVRPSPLPTAIMILGLAYAMWHFGRAYYTGNDTLSHWGLAVKYLIRLDRFPDASTRLIYFQTYPLGTACLLYSFCRVVGFREGYCMAAQFALYLAALLPVVGLIRKNRLAALIALAAVGPIMLTLNGWLTSLQVDSLLAFMTVGGAAMLAFYSDRPGRAAAAVLPVMTALACVKSSGLAFSFLLACGLFAVGRRAGRTRLGLRLALVGTALTLAVFGLWQLHVKLAFQSGFESKHAVSLRAYGAIMADKSAEDVRAIAAGMLRRLRHPDRAMRLTACLCLGLDVLVGLALWRLREDRSVWAPRLLRIAVGAVALFGLWYALMFAMYLFSMPREEALLLAAIRRYERTMLLLILGVRLCFAMAYFCREGLQMRARQQVPAVLVVLALGALLLCGTVPGRDAVRTLARRPASHPPEFASMLRLSRGGKVAPERSYWVFSSSRNRRLGEAYYGTKYEFFSNDILLIMADMRPHSGDPEGYYFFRDTYMQQTEYERVEDFGALLARHLDSVDYLLIYDEDPMFEDALSGFLRDYTGNAKVLRGYEIPNVEMK